MKEKQAQEKLKQAQTKLDAQAQTKTGCTGADKTGCAGPRLNRMPGKQLHYDGLWQKKKK